MFPKMGKKLHEGRGGDDEFRHAVAEALRRELGTTHQAIKTVMRWTNASERTVKHWFAGTHGPSGYHLVTLACHSDAVLTCFLLAAGRPQLFVGLKWASIRPMLMDIVHTIDAFSPSDS